MTAILGFLFAGLTIRWLGEGEAGFAIAIATILGLNNTFSGLGLGTATTRLISQAYQEKDWQRIQDVAGVYFTTSLAFGLVGLGLLSLGSSWIVQWSRYQGNANIGRLFCIVSGLTFFLQQITGYYSMFFISLQRFDWQTKLNTAFLLANGVFGITLLRAFPNILTLGMTSLILTLLNCICTGFIVTRLLRMVIMPSWSQTIFTELWSFGKWVYLTEIKVSFIDGLDKVFLTSAFGSSSLAYYSFSQRVYLTIHGMLVGQSSYLLPMLSAQGKNLEAVAEQIGDRLRWLIAILSALIYSGLIIAGPGLLSLMINDRFSTRASFQLFVFAWVGYIHAQAIVTYFFNFSKGLARENWSYVMVTGLGYFPVFAFLALRFSPQYAVLGQLMMILGVVFLLRNAHPKMNWVAFFKWVMAPVTSSLLLMIAATAIYSLLIVTKANLWTQLGSLIIFYLAGSSLVIRLENYYVAGRLRIDTLRRAVSLFGSKFHGEKKTSS